MIYFFYNVVYNLVFACNDNQSFIIFRMFAAHVTKKTISSYKCSRTMRANSRSFTFMCPFMCCFVSFGSEKFSTCWAWICYWKFKLRIYGLKQFFVLTNILYMFKTWRTFITSMYFLMPFETIFCRKCLWTSIKSAFYFFSTFVIIFLMNY